MPIQQERLDFAFASRPRVQMLLEALQDVGLFTGNQLVDFQEIAVQEDRFEEERVVTAIFCEAAGLATVMRGEAHREFVTHPTIASFCTS